MGVTVEEMFRHYTKRTGELSRNLSLVGVGAIWLLYNKFQIKGGIPATLLDEHLKIALVLIFVSLSLDVLQYIVGTFQWGKIYKNDSTAHIDAYTQKTPIHTAYGFIISKILSMVIAYVFIYMYMIKTPMFQGA